MAWGLEVKDPMKKWGETHDDDVPKYSGTDVGRLAQPEGQMELLKLCRAPDDGKPVRCDDESCIVKGSTNPCEAIKSVLKEQGIFIPENPLCQTGRYCFMEEFARFWAHNIEGAACKNAPQSACASRNVCSWDEVCVSNVR